MDGYENVKLLQERLENEGSKFALLELTLIRANAFAELHNQGLSRTLPGKACHMD